MSPTWSRRISGLNSASGGFDQKLFDAETGQYGAGKEKQALKGFADKLRDDVGKQLEAFLTSADPKCRMGLITLSEISNTKATLFITELYLTCLLKFARDHSDKCPRILIRRRRGAHRDDGAEHHGAR